MRARTLTGLVVTGALALTPALVQASEWIGQNGEGESSYKVSRGAIVPGTTGKIIVPSTFKCNLLNLALVVKRVPLTRGKINFTGKAVASAKPHYPSLIGTVTWKGTPTRGTIRLRTPKTPTYGPPPHLINKKCDTGTLRYAHRSGTPSP
jgi:hypothetical protein